MNYRRFQIFWTTSKSLGGVSPMPPARHFDQRRPSFVQMIVVAAIVLFSLISTIRSASSDDSSPKRGPEQTGRGVLNLSNGDHVSGSIVRSASNDSICWQSNAFETPFDFPLHGVASVHFSIDENHIDRHDASYLMELATGDAVQGDLLAITPEEIHFQTVSPGTLKIDRQVVHRISRHNKNSGMLFIGPTGLNGWDIASGAWREDSGHLSTDEPNAILRRQFGIPNRARIEFELSWSQQPDFELALAVNENSTTVAKAFRVDVWEKTLLIQREADSKADLGILQSSVEKTGRIHLQAFLDQLAGRIQLYSPSGALLCELDVQTKTPAVYGGIQLTNRRGNVSLERLQISEWHESLPDSIDLEKPQLLTKNGTSQIGTVQSFDRQRRVFQVLSEQGVIDIPEDQFQMLVLPKHPIDEPTNLRLAFHDGVRLSGEVIQLEQDAVSIRVPGIQEPVRARYSSLESLIILEPQVQPVKSEKPEGRLESAGTVLHGYLDNRQSLDGNCLSWRPVYSTTSSPLRPPGDAKIIFRDPPNPAVAAVAIQTQVPVVPSIPQRILNKTVRKSVQSSDFIFHLRTGDRIPCSEVSIDEQGLTFRSHISEATFVPHEKIHALELMPNATPIEIDAKKRERLLTLPRTQRNHPPKHLIRSNSGDYLRGDVISMNDAQLHVELRLEGKIVRRDRVARIIWLHPESQDTEPASLVNGAVESMKKTLVHAIYQQPGVTQSRPIAESNRLTFHPIQLKENEIVGTSDLFGNCRIEIPQLDQLLIGAAIENASSNLPFGSWKLRAAAEPLGPKDDESEGESSDEGRQSPLVGKPAPEMSAKSLDGESFQLADRRGAVVVLDFWASWCGPCIQTMPQIDRVAAEFADQGVELYAINLEETPEKIRAALVRLKLDPKVILDPDGRIAERYGATSIPQTVIIDRKGTVARLFVGGGPRFDDKLRKALEQVLSAETPAKE